MNNSEILNKLLFSISKGLNIANKLIPIYQDSKPLFSNAKNIYNLFKTSHLDNEVEEKEKITSIKKETIKKEKSNSPQFFI